MGPIDLDRVKATTQNGVVVDMAEYKARAEQESKTARSVLAPAVAAFAITGKAFLIALAVAFFLMFLSRR